MNIDLIEEFLENLKKYINSESQKGKQVFTYEKNPNPPKLFERLDIRVELDKHKEIILQEETRFELGGINNKSFSLVYPFSNLDTIKHINNGRITLIGPEIKDISDLSIDFGMVILIG